MDDDWLPPPRPTSELMYSPLRSNIPVEKRPFRMGRAPKFTRPVGFAASESFRDWLFSQKRTASEYVRAAVDWGRSTNHYPNPHIPEPDVCDCMIQVRLSESQYEYLKKMEIRTRARSLSSVVRRLCLDFEESSKPF